MNPGVNTAAAALGIWRVRRVSARAVTNERLAAVDAKVASPREFSPLQLAHCISLLPLVFPHALPIVWTTHKLDTPV